jgi:carboxymethylenebutenolidase
MTSTQNQSYIALPDAGKGSAVLVLHAWWGLNDFFRSLCDQLAGSGYVAMAPDMFNGKIARTIKEAAQHLSEWDEARDVPPIILPAVEELTKHTAVKNHGLGVIGFSMGAYWALWLAQKRPELIRAVVLFYGTDGGGGDFQQSKANFLGHFAATDPYETPSGIQKLEDKLKDAKRPATFFTYPGTGHWFFEKDRPDAYNPQAAQLAWDRTLKFLSESFARE